MKEYIYSGAVGVIGSIVASLFGGWNGAMTTLIIFMAIDFISGLLVAGVFHASEKSKNGSLESAVGWKGLFRKCMTLACVIVAYRLDLVLGMDYIENAVIIAFCANEVLSITENAGLMGVPFPKVVTDAVNILKSKSDKEE